MVILICWLAELCLLLTKNNKMKRKGNSHLLIYISLILLILSDTKAVECEILPDEECMRRYHYTDFKSNKDVFTLISRPYAKMLSNLSQFLSF